MEFFNEISEVAEVSEIKSGETSAFSESARNKFDKIMGDDKIDISNADDFPHLTLEERESKYNKLFDVGDFFNKHQAEQTQTATDLHALGKDSGELSTQDNVEGDCLDQVDISKKREANSSYELNGNVYETDDNGNTYKKNGEILSNAEYTVNGNIYKTDERGNKISCDSEPRYTEDGVRNNKEQRESGGDERQEDDDGGHIIANILGGAEGEENLVPMRRTINRGDYKKMENEIAKALQEGKKAMMHIELKYDGDSKRPSKFRAEYSIDGKETVVEFDNKEASTELLDLLKGKITDLDFNNLKEEIEDMKEDGVDATVTSVKIEYDEKSNPTKVTVGELDESTGQKTYKVYNPR